MLSGGKVASRKDVLDATGTRLNDIFEGISFNGVQAEPIFRIHQMTIVD
jgi:hypothetical protein